MTRKIKDKIQARMIFFCLGIYICTGNGYVCAESKRKRDLPSPRWTLEKKRISDKPSLDVNTTEFSNNMIKNIILLCGEKKQCTPFEKNRYFSALKKGVEFLVNEYGKARYSKKITIIVTHDPKVNGVMLWKKKNLKNRVVSINEINFEKSEWRVLVHELFHAYYETDSFILNYPDFISEGLAMYVEYKYRYPNKVNSEIAEIMLSHAKSLGYPTKPRFFDYDISFSHYKNDIDLIYVLSGLFFMTQNSNVLATKIPIMLKSKNNVQFKFKKIIQLYNLEQNEYASIPSPIMPPASTKVFSDTKTIKNTKSDIVKSCSPIKIEFWNIKVEIPCE